MIHLPKCSNIFNCFVLCFSLIIGSAKESPEGASNRSPPSGASLLLLSLSLSLLHLVTSSCSQLVTTQYSHDELIDNSTVSFLRMITIRLTQLDYKIMTLKYSNKSKRITLNVYISALHDGAVVRHISYTSRNASLASSSDKRGKLFCNASVQITLQLKTSKLSSKITMSSKKLL